MIFFRDPCWRGGQSPAADLGGHCHHTLGFFQSLGTPGIIVDDPLGKADYVLNRQAKIRDPFAQFGQRSAGMDILVQFGNPGFDPAESGPGRDFKLGNQRQFLTADRACIETIAEWLSFVVLRSGLGRCTQQGCGAGGSDRLTEHRASCGLGWHKANDEKPGGGDSRKTRLQLVGGRRGRVELLYDLSTFPGP